MRVFVGANERLFGLYEVSLHIEGEKQARPVLYLPDVLGEHDVPSCNPVPSVARAAGRVREIFGMGDSSSLFHALSVDGIPRFDDYDELHGFAYALGIIEPFLERNEVSVIGEQECTDDVRVAFWSLSRELVPWRPRSYVLGGQRRFAQALAKGRCYENRPLEWICVSERGNQFKQAR